MGIVQNGISGARYFVSVPDADAKLSLEGHALRSGLLSRYCRVGIPEFRLPTSEMKLRHSRRSSSMTTMSSPGVCCINVCRQRQH